MRLSDLDTAEDVLAEDLRDPAFRAEWDRTGFAREVAKRLVAYRAEHHLSQTQLARQVGTVQSVIARLESGDQPPSLATLTKLSRGLGIEFHLTITPTSIALSA
jgi:ribosome-binding protein aMBF1 (putative translation factor)